MGQNKKHYIYIVKCADDTLYTGYTVDLNQRIGAHNCAKGAKYTRGRIPVKLVYSEEFSSMSEALKREGQIKRMTRDKKIEMINVNKLNGGFPVEEIFSN
ncbi:GIY-YIG nuclease family protein [Proteocatella sphenisci]|uniref:GIY-YIG nuclease family protein n=1 Tax=Proteocatella sphenisci TaxID=181070 RepID=UPI0004B2230F|nr:GIY-YIG nuclease family protein [Proteocatella sphenisci]